MPQPSTGLIRDHVPAPGRVALIKLRSRESGAGKGKVKLARPRLVLPYVNHQMLKFTLI